MSSHKNFYTCSFENLFLEDPVGELFFKHWIGERSFSSLRTHFVEMGRRAALAQELSATADRLSPRLETDESGSPRVSYDPSYRKLEELAYGGGIISIKYDPEFLSKNSEIRHLLGFGVGYYFAQTEVGLYCPICMTEGVAYVLEKCASEEIKSQVIPHLTSQNLDELWQGAMFLTERHAGSDVGECEVQATNRDGQWLLNGEKWFCSNADAEAILVLARMPEAPEGTNGLGLFLVLREQPAENANTIRIDRLKEKLGVRSMPTGEITLENTRALLIGGCGEGFKQMTHMLNMSRLYNSIASVAVMRRATLEALRYGSQRTAFGHTLNQLPLWRATMQDVHAEQLGAFLLAFEAVRALDRSEQGDTEAAQLLRILTPLAKALTGKLAVFITSECMEAIGGNGYIEDSIMPRLLRDAQVLPIWEGTTNVLSLDTIRAITREGSDGLFFQKIEAMLAHAARQKSIPAESIAFVTKLAKQSRDDLEQLKSIQDSTGISARGWLESAGRTITLALLLRAASESDLHSLCMAAFQRLRDRPHSTSPAGLQCDLSTED